MSQKPVVYLFDLPRVCQIQIDRQIEMQDVSSSKSQYQFFFNSLAQLDKQTTLVTFRMESEGFHTYVNTPLDVVITSVKCWLQVDCIRITTRRGQMYSHCLKELLRAKPRGTPEGEGVYLTLYPKLSPNTDPVQQGMFYIHLCNSLID